VVVGGGFIGLEVASSALRRDAAVTVLEAATRPLARVMPPAPAERIAALHREAGVDLRLGAVVTGFADECGGAVRLETNAGPVIGDVVVVGIGVTPNLELAADAGLAVDDGIVVDAQGATSDPHVFAAGEVTRHPAPGAERCVRLESWQVAELQAQAAGRSAAGAAAAHDAIPWFWSDQLGANLQMLGFVDLNAPLVSRDYGDGAAAWFALDDKGRVRGAITLNAGRDIAVARRLMARELAVDSGRLSDPTTALAQLLRS
jgi:NADPH-dependent 2,4-dienoyl-CoA reductase/sulfur reductase-like enzyme